MELMEKGVWYLAGAEMHGQIIATEPPNPRKVLVLPPKIENLENPYKRWKGRHLSSESSLITISKLLKIGNKSSFPYFSGLCLAEMLTVCLV